METKIKASLETLNKNIVKTKKEIIIYKLCGFAGVTLGSLLTIAEISLRGFEIDPVKVGLVLIGFFALKESKYSQVDLAELEKLKTEVLADKYKLDRYRKLRAN